MDALVRASSSLVLGTKKETHFAFLFFVLYGTDYIGNSALQCIILNASVLWESTYVKMMWVGIGKSLIDR